MQEDERKKGARGRTASKFCTPSFIEAMILSRPSRPLTATAEGRELGQRPKRMERGERGEATHSRT